jgi:phage/plasmid primase-like uncharacterized protein
MVASAISGTMTDIGPPQSAPSSRHPDYQAKVNEFQTRTTFRTRILAVFLKVPRNLSQFPKI